MATLAGIRAAVFRNLDRPNAETSSTAAEQKADIDRFTNQVIREVICLRHNWAFMEARWEASSITASTALYAWPDPDVFKDVQRMYVRDDSDSAWTELREMTENAVWSAYEGFIEERKPEVFSRRGEGFRLTPTPDVGTYQLTILGWKYPAELSGDSATNTLTQNYSRLLELWVTARAFEHYQESERAQVWLARAETELAEAIEKDRRRLMPINGTMRPSFNAGRAQRGPRRLGLVGYW